jgi:hypothetical protein
VTATTRRSALLTLLAVVDLALGAFLLLAAAFVGVAVLQPPRAEDWLAGGMVGVVVAVIGLGFVGAGRALLQPGRSVRSPLGCAGLLALPTLALLGLLGFVAHGSLISHRVRANEQHTIARLRRAMNADPTGVTLEADGYRLTPGTTREGWTLTARPLEPGRTGLRSFCRDSSGRLCFVPQDRTLELEAGACPRDCSPLP